MTTALELDMTPFEDLVRAVRRFVDGNATLTNGQRQELLAELRPSRSANRDGFAAFDALSAKERSVMCRLVAGDPAGVIAATSFVSLATVRTQVRAIFHKLGVTSQLAAVAMARDAGWPER